MWVSCYSGIFFPFFWHWVISTIMRNSSCLFVLELENISSLELPHPRMPCCDHQAIIVFFRFINTGKKAKVLVVSLASRKSIDFQLLHPSFKGRSPVKLPQAPRPSSPRYPQPQFSGERGKVGPPCWPARRSPSDPSDHPPLGRKRSCRSRILVTRNVPPPASPFFPSSTSDATITPERKRLIYFLLAVFLNSRTIALCTKFSQ